MIESAHEELAVALWKLGRQREALEAVEAGIQALPGRVRLHLVRGRILESRGRWEEAAHMPFSMRSSSSGGRGGARGASLEEGPRRRLEAPAREAVAGQLRRLERTRAEEVGRLRGDP